MTWVDHIVEEVRQIRDAHAARFNYDLKAIFQDIKEQERNSGRQFINGVAKPNSANSSLDQTGNEPADSIGIESIH